MKLFSDRLAEAVVRTGTGCCIGLDPHLDRLPDPLFQTEGSPVQDEAYRVRAAKASEAFCVGVLEVLEGRAPSVKPQVAFFEALGAPGWAALERVMRRAREMGFLTVLDAKRGDIGSTAHAYAKATLSASGPLKADSVTLSPYLGEESLLPFLSYCEQGKGVFVLVRTSNPGAEAWQCAGSPSLAEQIADWMQQVNQRYTGSTGLGPVGAVIGATLGDELPKWRERLSHSWLLVPGYGAQGAGGADVTQVYRADGLGALTVSARGVLFGPSGREGDDWQARISDRLNALNGDLRANCPPLASGKK